MNLAPSNPVVLADEVQREQVLLDMILPRMNGKEACDEILKTKPYAKILFKSGYTGDTLGQQGPFSEETGLIQKPLKPRDLLIKRGKLLA